jgi:hypothetical protein
MSRSDWTPAEKKIARQAFDKALQTNFAQIMASLKDKAAVAATPADLWEIEDFLREARRGINMRFDYRYSQLLSVFTMLIHEGLLSEQDLEGLSEPKLAAIREDVSWWANRRKS